MIHRFLTAKHWQLFILMVAIPVVIEIGFAIAIIFHAVNMVNHGGVFDFSLLYFFPVIILIMMGSFIMWLWSVGVGLQPLISEPLRPKLTMFRVCALFPVIYMTLFSGFIINSIQGTGPNPYIFLFIVPLHFFAMFCMLYNMFFVAKTYKIIELQREVDLSDFIGEFFLLWIYPVGIWFIQPKINKMAEKIITQDL